MNSICVNFNISDTEMGEQEVQNTPSSTKPNSKLENLVYWNNKKKQQITKKTQSKTKNQLTTNLIQSRS